MPSLLVIEVSPNMAQSASRALTARFVDEWCAANPGGAVTVRDMVSTPLGFIDATWIQGAFAPPAYQSPESVAAIRFSDELIAEVMAADHILIGTPMHNLMIPASLKAYIDQVVRVGATVSPNNKGLVTGKKAAVIIASGGNFATGSPVESFNHAAPYLRTVLGFIGITDLQIIMAGPSRPVMMGEQSLADFAKGYDAQIASLLASWQT